MFASVIFKCNLDIHQTSDGLNFTHNIVLHTSNTKLLLFLIRYLRDENQEGVISNVVFGDIQSKRRKFDPLHRYIH